MAAAAQNQIQDLHNVRLLNPWYIQHHFACNVWVTDHHNLLHDGQKTC